LLLLELQPTHVYEIRPREDRRGVDLICDTLPFGRLVNGEPDDVIIKGGTVYDGTGAEPEHVDVAIRGDRIAGVGDFTTAKAKTVIDATGIAVEQLSA